MSSASLEALPLELLVQILEYLRTPLCAIARLLQCSRLLHDRLEPVYWKREDVLENAMYWGCLAGIPEAIRLAVSYGADVNLVDAPKERTNENSLAPALLTLDLAARRGRVGAFRCLLELGASLADVPVNFNRELFAKLFAQLIKHVCDSASTEPEIALMFFRAGLDLQIKETGLHGPQIYQPLVRLIEAGASTEVLSLCIDHGADLDKMQSSTNTRLRREGLTPLSAAILMNSAETIRLLLTRGASIRGDEEHLEPTPQALHLPIFAAAYAMATSQSGHAMMKLCLENGADINQQTRLTFEHDSSTNKYRRNPPQYGIATPIYVFLNAITVWSDEENDPIEGLLFLLEHGASLDYAQTDEHRPPKYKDLIDWRFLQVFLKVSPLEMIFRARGIERLAYPRCRAAAELLVKQGALKDSAASLLKKYASSDFEPRQKWYDERCDGQKALVEIVTCGLQEQHTRAEASEVLWEYVTALQYGLLPEVSKHVIISLTRIGADINAPFEAYHDTPMPSLYVQCERLNSTVSGAHRIRQGKSPEIEKFFSFLKRSGADPYVRVEGQTALDKLLYKLDRRDAEAQKCLRGVAAVLRGEGDRGPQLESSSA